MSGTCRSCQRLVKRHDGLYECRGYPPTPDPDDPHDAPGVWPVVHPDEPACGIWLHRLKGTEIPERPDIYAAK